MKICWIWSQEHDNIFIAKAISSFMDSSKEKKATDKQTNKIWRIYWQLRLLSFWDVKGLLQTQKSHNLKNYYYANKFSNSTIAIRCQSSSNLFSYVIYYVIYLPLSWVFDKLTLTPNPKNLTASKKKNFSIRLFFLKLLKS